MSHKISFIAARALALGLALVLTLVLLLVLAEGSRVGAAEVRPSEKKPEKQVTFYHTYGYEKKGQWIIPMRVWVHEEPGIEGRGLALAARAFLADRAGLDELTESEKEIFRQRAQDFIADSESRETVTFMFDNDSEKRTYTVTGLSGEQATDRNGLLEGILKLEEKTAARLLKEQGATRGWLRFHVTSAEHWGTGHVRLIPPTGLSVISDIDDTIKITGIPVGEGEVLKNTFFRDFIPVPGMAEMYAGFGDDVAFHYVSGNPWQMYQPLVDFLLAEPAGFPPGSFHMKNLRTNPFASESYRDIWTLVANGTRAATFAQKILQISAIMTHFPKREFILIGDSGEKDPEVFKQIRQDFPAQVREIRIRLAGGEETDARLDNMTRIAAEPQTD